ncbi:uncharacterized protein LOC120355356 [Nilaparvata lugens]|uniref:uncharacterized protein LOC120355356 n=1 Tax=Nilaparvata lugens TaxID=108931 RepID=UPI00193D5456|nr:uncharacterized protein LOC120355356 [Nilaparvata lugens]
MLPYWNIWAKPGKYYEPQLISQADFTNHFVVTKHEIWQCNIEDKGKFLRSVVEYVGKTPMRTVEFYDDNTVWKFNLNGHQSRSAAVRAIHYYKENDLRVTYKYNGLVKLIQQKQGFVRRIVDAYGNFLANKPGKFIVETGKI